MKGDNQNRLRTSDFDAVVELLHFEQRTFHVPTTLRLFTGDCSNPHRERSRATGDFPARTRSNSFASIGWFWFTQAVNIVKVHSSDNLPVLIVPIAKWGTPADRKKIDINIKLIRCNNKLVAKVKHVSDKARNSQMQWTTICSPPIPRASIISMHISKRFSPNGRSFSNEQHPSSKIKLRLTPQNNHRTFTLPSTPPPKPYENYRCSFLAQIRHFEYSNKALF